MNKEVIYNVTVKVQSSIANDWIKWLLEEHIPAIMQTGCFTTHRVVQLLETDDSEGPTYAIQYHANSISDYQRYIDEHAAHFRQDSIGKWGDRFIAFRSIMQVIHQPT